MSIANYLGGATFIVGSASCAYQALSLAVRGVSKEKEIKNLESFPFIDKIGVTTSRIIKLTSKVALWTLASGLSASMAYWIIKGPTGNGTAQPQNSSLSTKGNLGVQELSGYKDYYYTGYLYKDINNEPSPAVQEEGLFFGLNASKIADSPVNFSFGGVVSEGEEGKNILIFNNSDEQSFDLLSGDENQMLDGQENVQNASSATQNPININETTLRAKTADSNSVLHSNGSSGSFNEEFCDAAGLHSSLGNATVSSEDLGVSIGNFNNANTSSTGQKPSSVVRSNFKRVNSDPIAVEFLSPQLIKFDRTTLPIFSNSCEAEKSALSFSDENLHNVKNLNGLLGNAANSSENLGPSVWGVIKDFALSKFNVAFGLTQIYPWISGSVGSGIVLTPIAVAGNSFYKTSKERKILKKLFDNVIKAYQQRNFRESVILDEVRDYLQKIGLEKLKDHFRAYSKENQVSAKDRGAIERIFQNK